MFILRRPGLIVGILLLGVGVVSAQETATPSPTAPAEAAEVVRVTVPAEDGLLLVGDYYAASAAAGERPAVILLHMNGSNRGAWLPLIPVLHEADYNVLNVDLRGHGDTGGRPDWGAAQQDMTIWMDYIDEQLGASESRIALVGGSIGANLALTACANDTRCLTAAALSPGWDFFGVMPVNAINAEGGLMNRSALLVASHDDEYSAQSVRSLVGEARGEVGARLYKGSAHGTNLFLGSDRESVTNLIVYWLDEHVG